MAPILRILALLLGGCAREPSGEAFSSFQLQDVELEHRAVSGWAFGSHTVHFYEVSSGARRHLGSTGLANDGAVVDGRNASQSALDRGRWELNSRGEEDQDQRWLIERSGPSLSIRRW